MVDTQYSTVCSLHSSPMNYDSEIGFLLLWLALFYHANECWLMVETWLAASQMGSKSPSNCRLFPPLRHQIFILLTSQMRSHLWSF